jgi:hypothetical protein
MSEVYEAQLNAMRASALPAGAALNMTCNTETENEAGGIDYPVNPCCYSNVTAAASCETERARTPHHVLRVPLGDPVEGIVSPSRHSWVSDLDDEINSVVVSTLHEVNPSSSEPLVGCVSSDLPMAESNPLHKMVATRGFPCDRELPRYGKVTE